MSDYGLPNTKSVNDFIGYIRERLAQSTTSWREIAEAFAEAKEMFGGESDSFRNLCKETNFSKSTAHKLAAIASSERLAKYREKLSVVHSWGTLYAITVADGREVQGPLRALQSRRSKRVQTDPHPVAGRSGSQGEDREVELESVRDDLCRRGRDEGRSLRR